MTSNFIEVTLEKIQVHKVGNKIADEELFLSKEDMNPTNEVLRPLANLFLSSFNSEEYYKFHHETDVAMNEVYTYVNKIFENNDCFLEQSQHIARHLYNQIVHPQIKGGELCVIYMKDCLLEGVYTDAIGLFKSENKDLYFEIQKSNFTFNINSKKGINSKKLDKGCLIFNIDKDKGYVVSLVDNTNKGNNAQYWKDNFLGIQPIENEYHKTNEFLGITKKFITQELSTNEDVSKADQINILNKSVEYFKNNETFETNDFEEQVFNNNEVLNSFKKFNQSFQEENNVQIPSEFSISKQAVKKQSRAFKKVLKLDKNFHIYIHGDRDLIEQGTETDGRKFYKIYYNSEQ